MFVKLHVFYITCHVYGPEDDSSESKHVAPDSFSKICT